MTKLHASKKHKEPVILTSILVLMFAQTLCYSIAQAHTACRGSVQCKNITKLFFEGNEQQALYLLEKWKPSLIESSLKTELSLSLKLA